MVELLAGPLKLLAGALGFGALALWEQARPAGRGRVRARGRRWPLNLTFLALSWIVARVFGFLGPVAVALWANQAGFGLMTGLGAPWWVSLPATLIVMDLALYAQHRAMHEVPGLWRLHRAHHTDPTLDVSSAFRFHPGEIGVSLVWKSLVAAAIGAPAAAVAAFEIWLMLASLYTHADVRLSSAHEKALRWLMATPGVHEQHHDRRVGGQHTNYSSGLTLWDRALGTWRTPPDGGVAALGVHGVSEGLAADIARGLVDPIAQDAANP